MIAATIAEAHRIEQRFMLHPNYQNVRHYCKLARARATAEHRTDRTDYWASYYIALAQRIAYNT